jgi:hypothetical protein
MPCEQKLKLGNDRLQPYKCRRALLSELQTIIEASNHAKGFLAVIDFQTRLVANLFSCMPPLLLLLRGTGVLWAQLQPPQQPQQGDS